MDIRFNATEENQARKEAVPVRPRIGRARGATARRRKGSGAAGVAVRDVQNGGGADGSAIDDFTELCDTEGVDDGASDSPPEERKSGGHGKWRHESRVMEGVRRVPEEFKLHSRRFGQATRKAAGGASDAVNWRDAGWASNAFVKYVGANMDDPMFV